MTDTTPYVITPDWTLRGGYTHLCVYREDTFEAISTHRIRSVAFREEVGTAVNGDGTLRVVNRVHAIAPELASWPAVTALRRWRGETVRAVLISARYGPHLIWDEDVPVVIEAVSDGLNTLAGDRLLLHTSKYTADIEHSADLLGTNYGTGWTGSASRVLPIPGLTVYVYGVGATVEAFDSAGSSLGAATAAGVALTLPANTWSVTCTASTRPVLVTRPLTQTGLILLNLSDGALVDDAADILYAL